MENCNQYLLDARALLEWWNKHPHLRPEGYVYLHGFYPPQLIPDPDPHQLPDKCRTLFLFAKNISSNYSPRFRDKVMRLPDISDEISQIANKSIVVLHSAVVTISLMYWNYYGNINGFDSPKLPDNLHRTWVECCRKSNRIPSITSDALFMDNIVLIRPEDKFCYENIRMRFPLFSADELGSKTEILFSGYLFAAIRYACQGIVDMALNLQLAIQNGDKRQIQTNLQALINLVDEASVVLYNQKLSRYSERSIVPSHWRHIGQVMPIPSDYTFHPMQKNTLSALNKNKLDWNTADDQHLFDVANSNSLFGSTISGLFDPNFAIFDIIVGRLHKSENGKVLHYGQRLLPKAYQQFFKAFKLGFEKTGNPKEYVKNSDDEQLKITFNLLERSYRKLLDIHFNKAVGVLSIASQMDRNITVANKEFNTEIAHKQISANLSAGIDDRQFKSKLYSATLHSTPANANQQRTLQYAILSAHNQAISHREGDKLGVLIPNNVINNHEDMPEYFTFDINTTDPIEKQWLAFVHEHFYILDRRIPKEIILRYSDLKGCKSQNTLSIFPPMIPRTYSIASFNSRDIKLLVERIDSGKVSPKLSPETYQVSEPKTVDFFVINSYFQLPKDTSKPIIMIGIGSGIAPYQSFIDRNNIMREGRHMLLYFGCRFIEDAPDVPYTKLCVSKNDSLEMNQRKNIYNGRVTSYLLSSEGQHTLSELSSQGAYIYICGPTSLYNDMIPVLKSALGEKHLLRMLSNDHIKIEVYRPTANDYNKIIPISDIVTHDGESNSSWIVIDNRVYDVSQYIDLHPGGDEVIKFVAGTDATELFNKFPSVHGKMARSILELYYIGDVEKPKESDKLYFQKLTYDTTTKLNIIRHWYGDKCEKQYYYLMKSLDAHVSCQRFFNQMEELLLDNKDGIKNKLSAYKVIHEYIQLINNSDLAFPYTRNNYGDLITDDEESKVMEVLHKYKDKIKNVDISYMNKLKQSLAKLAC